MNAFIAHFLFEFRTGIRNRSLLFMTYLFPLSCYFLLGALMTAVNTQFKETMIPAMIIFTFLASLLLSLPNPLVHARQTGIFRSYWINGVPSSSILIISLLSAFVHLVVTGLFITLSAPLIFHAPMPADAIAFILVFIAAAFAFGSLGLLIGVLSSSLQMAMLLGQLVFLPSMLLGGLMMPADLLPPALEKISLLLPTIYAVSAFQGFAYHLPTSIDPTWSVFILFTAGLIAFTLALFLFTWDKPDARQKKRLPLGLFSLLPYFLGMLFLS